MLQLSGERETETYQGNSPHFKCRNAERSRRMRRQHNTTVLEENRPQMGVHISIHGIPDEAAFILHPHPSYPNHFIACAVTIISVDIKYKVDHVKYIGRLISKIYCEMAQMVRTKEQEGILNFMEYT